MRRIALAADLTAQVEALNAAYPIGTPVTAYPGIRPEDPLAERNGYTTVTGRTKTKVWVPRGHDRPVVMVTGHSAWIAMSHVDRVRVPGSVVAVGALGIRCTHCNAERGDYCRTDDGKTRHTHEARRKLWRELGSPA
jgi:hypothetical protein